MSQRYSKDTGGDLWATVRAIVTDPEADAPALSPGKLKEPVLFILGFYRNMDGDVTIENSLNSYANNMGQNLRLAPSVFNYFSPGFRVNGIQAPEFQSNTPSVALIRANFMYRASRNGLGTAATFDIAHFERLASDPPALVEALNQCMLAGSMSPETRTAILAAVNSTTDVRVRARNAIYLVGTSSQYQVEP